MSITLAMPHIDVDGLVAEIEHYLAAQPVPPRALATAHPLVARTTADLVAEALGSAPAATATPTDRAPATAHPLVTRTTADLVAEALGSAPAATATPHLAAPPALLRRLPRCLLLLVRRATGTRQISAADHLELTALIIQRWGWTQGTDRDATGARCILGAQRALLALGYGDADTLGQAAAHLYHLVDGAYDAWQDHPDRTQEQVLRLLRTAARQARQNRR